MKPSNFWGSRKSSHFHMMIMKSFNCDPLVASPCLTGRRSSIQSKVARGDPLPSIQNRTAQKTKRIPETSDRTIEDPFQKQDEPGAIEEIYSQSHSRGLCQVRAKIEEAGMCMVSHKHRAFFTTWMVNSGYFWCRQCVNYRLPGGEDVMAIARGGYAFQSFYL